MFSVVKVYQTWLNFVVATLLNDALKRKWLRQNFKNLFLFTLC
ncbi:MAG: hypothetical protein RL607_1373 [Bacteroidota bacterium]|jgi:hypothetical protein